MDNICAYNFDYLRFDRNFFANKMAAAFIRARNAFWLTHKANSAW